MNGALPLASLMTDIAINVLAALAILTFIASQVAQWRASKRCDEELDDCTQKRRELEEEHLRLMRKLVRLENGSD
jgi:hypothetical protein